MSMFALPTVIETAAVWGTRAAAIGSEIFTVTALLWALNMLSIFTEKTYNAGYAVGKFYRAYLHSHCKSAAIHTLAFVVLLIQLAYEGALYVYQNRRLIQQRINEQFVYVSPSYAAV